MKVIRMVLLVLFLLAGGTVFYLGWIQIHLDENTYGIAYTKTKGYLPEVYSPGEFSWSIHRLIPGNFKLFTFHIEPQTITVTGKGVLPSGTTYSKYLPGQPDFSYHFSYSISYILKAAALPELLSSSRLAPGKLPEFYSRTKLALTSAVEESLLNAAAHSDDTNGTFSFSSQFTNSLKQMIQKKFDYLTLLNLTPIDIRFPDRALYLKAKENYFANLNSRSKLETEARKKAAETVVQENSRIELLKKYGELFKNYPELVQLLIHDPVLRAEIFPEHGSSRKAKSDE